MCSLGSARPAASSRCSADGPAAEQLVQPVAPNLSLLPSESGAEGLYALGALERARLHCRLVELSQGYEVVVVDAGAGIEGVVRAATLGADRVVLVTAPEPTALMDAHALAKMLSLQAAHVRIDVLVNRCADEDEGQGAFIRLAAAAEQFLNRRLHLAGILLEEPPVAVAVRDPRRFLARLMETRAAATIRAMKLDLLGLADINQEPRVNAATATIRNGTMPAELWQRYRETADPEARRELLELYIGLVHHVAREMSRRTKVELDDLVSAGTFGLIRALDSFDLSRGLAFSTYAVRRIRGAILDDLRSQDWAPRAVRVKARRLQVATVALEARLGRSPRPEEVAEQLDIDITTYWRWRDDTATRTAALVRGRAAPAPPAARRRCTTCWRTPVPCPLRRRWAGQRRSECFATRSAGSPRRSAP